MYWVLMTAKSSVVGNWRQPKCPSLGEWISKMWQLSSTWWLETSQMHVPGYTDLHSSAE